MAGAKQIRTYVQQLELLELRGMTIEDPAVAASLLRQHSYYRLSGYWHPMRRFDPETGRSLDLFHEGASFKLVIDLYLFDEQLRHAIFSELTRIELGQNNPLIHLNVDLLGARRDRVAVLASQRGMRRLCPSRAKTSLPITKPNTSERYRSGGC